jgi:hypothetical protein
VEHYDGVQEPGGTPADSDDGRPPSHPIRPVPMLVAASLSLLVAVAFVAAGYWPFGVVLLVPGLGLTFLAVTALRRPPDEL